MLVSFFKLVKFKGFSYTGAHTHFDTITRSCNIQFFHFEGESFSAPTKFPVFSAPRNFIGDQMVLQCPLLHIILLPISAKRKFCLHCPHRIMSLSASLRMDFHVAKMAVELFSRQCAIAALSLIAIVHSRCITSRRTFNRPRLAVRRTCVYFKRRRLHACTCIPLQQHRVRNAIRNGRDI